MAQRAKFYGKGRYDTKVEQMTELKPCPWCGEMPTVYEDEFIWIGCECDRCPVQPEGRIVSAEEKAELFKQWNTRAEDKGGVMGESQMIILLFKFGKSRRSIARYLKVSIADVDRALREALEK